MVSEIKTSFLRQLTKRVGSLRKLKQSQSLFELRDQGIRFYVRYSKVHSGNKTFFGLRSEDLQKLEGHTSVLCFLWDEQSEPLFVPFSSYEEIFRSVTPAKDGQFKVQIYLKGSGSELYIAQAGRFNVEGYFGWNQLDYFLNAKEFLAIPDLSHWQVQTLVGSIGASKGFEVWVPLADRGKLDWSMTTQFQCLKSIPHGFEEAADILQEIDVFWIERGSSNLRALFEIEHSTPIYSGLLRFNDIHLVTPNLQPSFSIVADEARRGVFVSQINRPTFKASGLNDKCTFLEYANIYEWHRRIALGKGGV